MKIKPIDLIMEQAQVFASTYSLVGGHFDDGTKMQQANDEKAELRALIELALEEPAIAEPEVKIVPRGGVERNWWEEYQLLLRRFKKLAKVARQCVGHVNDGLARDLQEALPKTYEEFKARNSGPEVTP